MSLSETPTRRSRELKITDGTGFHLRPAVSLVKLACAFDAKILIQRGEQSANAKSLLSVLELCARDGADVSVLATGVDADEAVRAIEAQFPAAEPGQGPASGSDAPPPSNQGRRGGEAGPRQV